MTDLQATGAIMVALVAIYIINALYCRRERRAAKDAHRVRVKIYSQKRVDAFKAANNEIKIVYSVHALKANKHRNTVFHSAECAAACGGRYVPKGEPICVD